MEPDDKSQSLENSPSFVIIQKMTADNQKQIELNDSLLKNTSFTALMEKFNADNITRNHPLAEDIENTVQELLKENVKLKETLLQNNIAMKEQFSTLEKWHNEVFELQRTHKKKFEETKELIYNLRAENKELKKPIQDYARNHENKELVELKMERDNLRQQLQESEQHCISLKNQLANVTRLPAENQLLKEKLQMTQQKLSKSEQHYSLNARSEKEQELIQVIGDLTRQLENSERSRRKLISDLDRLSAQEQKLQRILPSGESKNITDYCYWNAIFPTAVISAPFEAQLVENMKRYEELLNKYESLSTDNVDNKETSSSWVNLNKNEQDASIDSLKLEVAELRKLLMQEQRLNISRKEILENAQSKFKELYKQCMTILKEHDTKMKAMEIEIVKRKEKLKDFEVLKYAVNDKDNKITQLENECAFLKKKIEEAERKNEDLYILQSQMKVYEEDFLTEREAREALANEKDLLQHNISRLQQKNKELMRELKMSQDGKGHKSRNNKDICEETHQTKKKFACFNETCSESFLSEEELQEHVYSCLNLKD